MNVKHVASTLFAVSTAFLLHCVGDSGPADADGGSCTPKTCQAQGFQCGSQTDGCGGTLECGTCPSGACNAGKCACTPKTCPELNAKCGAVDDGCGHQLDCGGCPAGYACNADHQCVCQPQNPCGVTFICGAYDDGCGGIVDCGDCTPYCGYPANCFGSYCDCGFAP